MTEPQTLHGIMDEMERRVQNNEPISPASWCESALRVNQLSGNLDNEIAILESMLNSIEAEYIKKDFPANKAKVLSRAEINYEELLKKRALKKRLVEYILLAKRRAIIPEI